MLFGLGTYLRPLRRMHSNSFSVPAIARYLFVGETNNTCACTAGYHYWKTYAFVEFASAQTLTSALKLDGQGCLRMSMS